jgi:hypothetical protein
LEVMQNMLRIHPNNGRVVRGVFEADAPGVLQDLGLPEFVEGWTFDSEKDVGT